MRLITTVSFLMLIFGTIEADINSNFNKLMQKNLDLKSFLIGDRLGSLLQKFLNLCLFGVKSVSAVLFTSDIIQDQPRGILFKGKIEIEKSCKFLNRTKPVIFLTHGFIANAYAYNFSDLALVLVENGYTVFSVDWSNASCYNDPPVINLLEYPAATHNTHKVGEYLASFVKSLIDVCKIPLKNITLMGHSLGAHISSYAARNLSDSGYGTPPLLIGTDPAAPFFLLHHEFSKRDAERVLAFHTSVLGIRENLGHCDLRFNGGYGQPACGYPIINVFNVNCSHNIAIEYLITIYKDCVYSATPSKPHLILDLWPGCSSNNCVTVDKTIFNKNSTLRGDYCVPVSSEYPYCIKKDSNCQT